MNNLFTVSAKTLANLNQLKKVLTPKIEFARMGMGYTPTTGCSGCQYSCMGSCSGTCSGSCYGGSA